MKWIERQTILYLHERAIARFGGSSGLRDAGLLESALARPRTLLAYRPDTTAVFLTAVYAGGILRNHPFVDGNKRTAALAIRAFLLLNGYDFRPESGEFAEAIELAAAGTLDDDALASRIAEWTTPL